MYSFPNAWPDRYSGIGHIDSKLGNLTMRIVSLTVIAMTVFATGCGDESAVKSPDQTGADRASEDCAVLFVNDWTISPSHGCFSKITSADTSQQEMVCGEKGHATRVRHQWKSRINSLDNYQIAWDLYADNRPADQPFPITTTIQKEVTFRGTTLVAMENDRQRVILYPCEQTHPPVVDASTPRSP